MPTSGPVYQPTTVSYEQQNEWSSQPRSYLAQTVNRVNNPRCVQWSLLALGLVSIAIGLILFIEGTIFTETHKSAITIESADASSGSSIVLAVAGVILIVLGVLLVVAYVRLVQRRKGWPCFNNKSQRLTRDQDNQTNNGQILTLNPSTDLLVTSSQYNTVHEAPPTLSEEEETRKLMGGDIKDSRLFTYRDSPPQRRSIVRSSELVHSLNESQFTSSPLSPRSLYEQRHQVPRRSVDPLLSRALSPKKLQPQEKQINSEKVGASTIPKTDLFAQNSSQYHPLESTSSSHPMGSSSPYSVAGSSVTSPLSARLLKALRAPLASVEDMTSSLESSAWSVTSRRDSVSTSRLLEQENVSTMTASRFSV